MSNVKLDFSWIEKAVGMVRSGLTNKVISPDKKIQVYQCGSVIRIDIKGA